MPTRKLPSELQQPKETQMKMQLAAEIIEDMARYMFRRDKEMKAVIIRMVEKNYRIEQTFQRSDVEIPETTKAKSAP